MRYTSKAALLADVGREWQRLGDLLGAIPRSRYREPGVWGDDWTIHDLVAHLAEWHAMFLGWFRAGEEGRRPEMPAPGYRWNETPRLNRAIRKKHAGRDFGAVEAEMTSTHEEVVDLLEGLSEGEILEPGHFDWTGRNALVAYAAANTASHYRFAWKVLRRWRRTQESEKASS